MEFIFGTVLDEREHPLGTQRTRTIVGWWLERDPREPGSYCLRGCVTTEADGPVDDRIRFTATSTIMYREGTNILITRSGSRYTLLSPRDPKQLTKVLEIDEAPSK